MRFTICPWWLGYLLASPLRRLVQDPRRILEPYVKKDMIVLEPGPGMGFFTLEIARIVGPGGRVLACDVQAKMLAVLRRRAAKAGLADRIDCRQVAGNALPIDDVRGKVDFALAFAMVHEVPDPGAFFADLAAALRPGAHALLAEPGGHVTADAFSETLGVAREAGFIENERPTIRWSRAAVLTRS
jgi:SAM-dependent methyltransferase